MQISTKKEGWFTKYQNLRFLNVKDINKNVFLNIFFAFQYRNNYVHLKKDWILLFRRFKTIAGVYSESHLCGYSSACYQFKQCDQIFKQVESIDNLNLYMLYWGGGRHTHNCETIRKCNVEFPHLRNNWFILYISIKI